jgi:hypothetical protein
MSHIHQERVVDHIPGGERQTALPDLGEGEVEADGIPEDEKSPWPEAPQAFHIRPR